MVKADLKRLMEVGAHFGHQVRRWNPKMDKYIYTQKGGIHVFDLVKTKELLDEALAFLTKSASEEKVIIFLGTKRQANYFTEKVAKDAGCMYVNERWLGGTITNFGEIQRSIQKLHEMKEDKAAGKFKKFTKKERVLLDREIDRLERFFGGISDLTGIPDVLVIIDSKRERAAVREANLKGVKVVAVADTNADPGGIDYIVPMNDDSSGSLQYVIELFGEAIKEGKKKPAKKETETKKANKTKKTKKTENKSEKSKAESKKTKK